MKPRRRLTSLCTTEFFRLTDSPNSDAHVLKPRDVGHYIREIIREIGIREIGSSLLL
jgi:hypothetical protein